MATMDPNRLAQPSLPIHSHLITAFAHLLSITLTRYINRLWTRYHLQSKCSVCKYLNLSYLGWFLYSGFDCLFPDFYSFDLALDVLLIAHRLTFAYP